MSGDKGPYWKERKHAALVDRLLEDLHFGEPGSKGQSGKSPATPKKQARPSGSGLKPISQKRPSGPAASAALPDPNARLGTWGRISLGVLIAIGMLQWPYDHSCGFKLGFYLSAVAMVMVSAGWGSVFSWKSRMPMAHAVSQGLLIWGLVLGAGQVLPRVGYAKDLATWRCVASPAPVTPAVVPTVSPPAEAAGQAALPVEKTSSTSPDSSG